MAAFPATLPAGSIDGYKLNPNVATVRTEMESGAARVRLRSKARVDQIAVTWVFEASEFATFRDWWESDTGANYGLSWFTVPLLTAVDNGELETATARFVGPWQASLTEPRIARVSATLEVRNA